MPNSETPYRRKTSFPGLRAVFFSAAIMAAVACGNDNVDPDPARDTTEPANSSAQNPPQAAAPPTQNSVGSADLRRGKIMFMQCEACHSTELDGEHKVGPNLHGVFGSKAGTKKGFVYSDTMAASNIVWDEQSLNDFLAKPSTYIPGTVMAFVGLDKADDRASVIAYLESQTQ